MTDRSALSTLPSIYNSAINPDIWGDTLESSARSLGAKGAILLIIDQQNQSGYQVNHFSKIWSRAPELAAMYNEKYGHYEKPVWEKLYSMERQQLVLDTDFWKDEKNLRERPDYKYLRENVGIVHKCAARLNDNLSWWDTVVFHFDSAQTQIPTRSIDGINLILPHIAKSVETARAFQQLKVLYNAVLAALDHIDIGICIAMENGDIVACNTEANRILDDEDGIRISPSGRLQFQDPEHQGMFNKAVVQTSATACGEQSMHEFVFANERLSGKDPVIVEVSPLRDYDNELSGRLSGSLITLVDPMHTRAFDIKRVAAAYNLTDAEKEVCKHLVDGQTNANMAEIRNVSIETIKSQVASVLQKTRCTRRFDLIRLVLKATPPIARPKDQSS